MTRTVVAMFLVSASACVGSQRTEPVRPMSMHRESPCDRYSTRPGTDRERTAQDAPEECWPLLNEPTITLTQSGYAPPSTTGEQVGRMPPAAKAEPVGKAPQ